MKLEIPPRAKPTRDSFDTSLKHVKAWVNALPLASGGEAARILFSTLCEINHTDIEPTERFKLLETFRSPLRHITTALEPHYMGRALPLTAANRKVAELACQFQREMAMGYKIVIHELRMVSGLPAILHRPLLVLSLQRALWHLSQILICCYQIYAPCPPNVWREIHGLYQLASKNKLERKPVSNPENTLVKEFSITDTYKQVLLLSLCDPYRLRQGDVLKVYTALERWIRYCDLAPIKGPNHKPRGLFGVQPDSDERPSYLALGERHDHTAPAGLVLDTTQLVQLLRDSLAYLDTHHETNDKRFATAKNPLSDISPNSLRRIMESWGMMVKRSYSRVDKRKTDVIDVTVGLFGIYHYLGGRETLQIEANQGEIEVKSGKCEGWATETSPRAFEHDVHSCHVMDESAGGYRLRWPSEQGIKAQVGDLIGVRRKDAHNNVSREQWRIGVIRWMRTADKENVEMGIQMLAPSARGATVRLHSTEQGRGNYLRCLLFPALRLTGQPETLVTQGPFLKYASQTQILVEGIERTVELTKILESTGSFVQFEYVELDERATRPSPAVEGRNSAQKFDSVWNNI